MTKERREEGISLLEVLLATLLIHLFLLGMLYAAVHSLTLQRVTEEYGRRVVEDWNTIQNLRQEGLSSSPYRAFPDGAVGQRLIHSAETGNDWEVIDE